ncbi:undecaprenyl-diphosphate phosphatase [Niveispirillum sp. KHB5.9]|uniref:undecaprenyl-diphosphate phosphatase n=1 Tax=Niveispirillum sp. KHB5.9 TaxID=3400269 RepID=UPI003A842224
MTDIAQYLDAILLGLLEGLTEFIPVSSTGHLILLGEMLGFKGQAEDLFKVVIQLGAILAILVVYFAKLWGVLTGLAQGRQQSVRFTVAILLAFLPAAVIGVFAHSYIKGVLFNPTVVSVALIVGGIVILLAERMVPQPRHFAVEEFSPKLSLSIGFAQCLAMIPGVSRSGATIIGALLMGVERKAAAEFSFFVAIPTMLGAATYDLYKNREVLQFDNVGMIAVGFATAFLSALLVVRWVVGFVSRHGFAPFAWYRIVIGSIMLAWLTFFAG